MTLAFVLATGPSMSQAQADSIRGRGIVVAVSDAYQLAPWANAMCSQDAAWWAARPDALQFAGLKYSGAAVAGCVRLKTERGGSSGLLGIHVATLLGATRIILLGFDMGGTHYFGPHTGGLKNTTLDRFEVFQRQFARYRPSGVEIINCTPGSLLRAYPKMPIDSVVNSDMIGA